MPLVLGLRRVHPNCPRTKNVHVSFMGGDSEEHRRARQSLGSLHAELTMGVLLLLVAPVPGSPLGPCRGFRHLNLDPSESFTCEQRDARWIFEPSVASPSCVNWSCKRH